ncbi:MAG: serine hydrolase domain-containing protein [Pseudomonadota bacterium]
MSDIDDLLSQTIETCQMPGAQLCVMTRDETFFVQAGFANPDTWMPVSEKTRFQLGSTTKPMIAFLAHQFAEAGKLDLKAPVSTYLHDQPDSSLLKNSDINTEILLSHTSGLCGDAFLDLGDSHAAETALIKAVSALPELHAAGKDTSYCNVGFVVCAEILRTISGQHWSDLFRTSITKQIDSETVNPWPEREADNLASGHTNNEPVERSNLSLSNAAAGTTLIGTARDLCEFGKLVLDSLEGEGPLSVASAESMTSLIAPLAPNERGLGFGHGMMIYSQDPFVFGHDGLTIGQQAYLRVFPERGVCVAFLGNGGDMRSAVKQIFEALSSLTGSSLQPPVFESRNADFESGVYERNNASLVIERGEETTSLSVLNKEPWAADLYGEVEGPYELSTHTDGGTYIYKSGSSVPYRVHFTDNAAYLGMRRYNKMDGPSWS